MKPKRIDELNFMVAYDETSDAIRAVIDKLNEIIHIVNAHNECGCIRVMEEPEEKNT